MFKVIKEYWYVVFLFIVIGLSIALFYIDPTLQKMLEKRISDATMGEFISIGLVLILINNTLR